VEFLIEIVVWIVGELVVECGFETLASPLLKERESNPIVAAAGLVIIGALFGCLTPWSYPTRVFADPPLPGASLVLSPLLSGIALGWFGHGQRKRGRETSHLATFWGGALLAIACALTRFLLL